MLRAWAAHDAEIYRAFTDTITRLSSKSLRDLRILDLGCGSNAPMTVLLHAAGCRVTGVDAYLGYRWGLGISPEPVPRRTRRSGARSKTLRKLAGEFAYDRVYFRSSLSRHGTRTDGVAVWICSRWTSKHPTLPASSFDAVHSNATWEHIADVRAANRAVAAALVPGGLAYIEIHLFPSLSGGHDLPWIVPGRTLLGDVRPWQHLRDPHWKAQCF